MAEGVVGQSGHEEQPLSAAEQPALPGAAPSSAVLPTPTAAAPEAPAVTAPAASAEARPHPRARPAKETHSWLGGVQSLASTVVIAVFVITFIVQAFQIPSVSMEKTLLVGDYLLVDKIHFAHGGIWGHLLPYQAIQRGEIVVFRYPVHPDQHFVKRVVAVPGDRVRLVNKQVFVNGRAVRESYAIHVAREFDSYRDDFPQPDLLTPALDVHWWLEMRKLVHGGDLEVPAERYFVLGDNRDESLDSRYRGFVPRDHIIGRPLMIYLSLRSVQEVQVQADDKLAKFGVFGQLMSLPRWRRTLRIVQ